MILGTNYEFFIVQFSKLIICFGCNNIYNLKVNIYKLKEIQPNVIGTQVCKCFSFKYNKSQFNIASEALHITIFFIYLYSDTFFLLIPVNKWIPNNVPLNWLKPIHFFNWLHDVVNKQQLVVPSDLKADHFLAIAYFDWSWNDTPLKFVPQWIRRLCCMFHLKGAVSNFWELLLNTHDFWNQPKHTCPSLHCSAS